MEEKKEKEIIKNNFLCTLRLKRVQKGIEIYFKSPMIEEFFSQQPKASVSSWMGLEGAWQTPMDQIANCLLNKWGYTSFWYDSNSPNLSFIRTVGSGEGIKFMWPTVTSTDNLKKWGEKAKEGLKTLYVQYLKPIELDITLTTREAVL